MDTEINIQEAGQNQWEPMRPFTHDEYVPYDYHYRHPILGLGFIAPFAGGLLGGLTAGALFGGSNQGYGQGYGYGYGGYPPYYNESYGYPYYWR